jgi:2,3-bisphosphoglycerate-independent phosphoglycerate mutase
VPVATIGEGDVVVFFNHRADTMRQLARSLAVPDPLASAKPNIEAICLTEYDRSYNLPVAFKPESAANMLAQIFEDRRIPNFRIAESDRFAHVTSFFNGGSERPGSYELHHHIPSSPSANRANQPELMSFKVTDRLLRGIESRPAGVFIVNLAAPDIIAETGNFEKTVEAIQYVDTCLGGMLEKIREVNGIAVVTSSHGHCEAMVDSNSGEANRLPTANEVPFHIIDESRGNFQLRSGGSLQDVAPTILGLLGIEQPAEMTGRDLRS